jgi:hypothetical protein
MTRLRTTLGGLFLVVSIGACSSAAGPTRSPVEDGSTVPGPTAVPGDPGLGGGSGGGTSGNSGSGNGGGGAVVPPPAGLGGGGAASVVVPQPGQLNAAPAFISGLTLTVDGRHVTARLTWTSGVEPCYVLDSVRVVRDDATITLTALEGHAPGNTICIEIAQLKATLVDLGELEPGTYLVDVEPGDATPVTIEIR